MTGRTPSEDEARERLRFHLEMQDGFWFALVVGDDPRPRARLRAAAEAWSEAFFLHRVGPDDLPGLAVRLAADSRPGLHWLVADGPGATAAEWEAAAGDALQVMNEHRDAYRRHVPAGVVFEGRERLKVVLRTRAPDLFSVRACILEPGSDPPQRRVATPELDWLEPFAWSPGEVDAGPWTWEGLRLSPDPEPVDEPAPERVAQVLEPVRRLEGREDAGAVRSRIGALMRAVEALRHQGWLTEAAPAVEQLRDLAEGLAAREAVPGWAHGVYAEAMEAQGEVARAAGDLTGARESLWLARDLRERLVAAAVEPARSTLVWREAVDLGSGWSRWPAALIARLDDLAAVEDTLASLEQTAGRLDEARRHLLEASEIRGRTIVHGGRTPERMSALAFNLSLQGELALRRGDTTASLAALGRALEVRRDVLAEDPSDPRFRRHVAIGLGRLAAALLAAGDLAGARERAEEGLDVARELAMSEPGNVAWQVDLSVAWSRLGDIARAEGAWAEAGAAYGESLALRRTLVDEDPENARWLGLLAVALGRVGEVARVEGDKELARASCEEAVDHFRQLVWQDPANADWARGLAAGLVALAEVSPGPAPQLREEAAQLRQKSTKPPSKP